MALALGTRDGVMCATAVLVDCVALLSFIWLWCALFGFGMRDLVADTGAATAVFFYPPHKHGERALHTETATVLL